MFDCPNLAVPMEVMQHVVRVESSRNPYAIGVVGGRLARQPRNIEEAVATAEMLQRNGYNFSLGIAQVNRYNLAKYGLNSYRQAFDVCSNLQAGTRILRECYNRSGGDWGKSFSCYYSGNFVTGFRHGYVQKVFASMRSNPTYAAAASTAPMSGAIPVASAQRAATRPAGGNVIPVPSVPQMQQTEPAMAYAAAPQNAPPPPSAPTRPADSAFVF